MPFCCKVSEIQSFLFVFFLTGLTSAQTKNKLNLVLKDFLDAHSCSSTTRRADRGLVVCHLALKAHCKQGKAGSRVRHRVS